MKLLQHPPTIAICLVAILSALECFIYMLITVQDSKTSLAVSLSTCMVFTALLGACFSVLTISKFSVKYQKTYVATTVLAITMRLVNIFGIVYCNLNPE